MSNGDHRGSRGVGRLAVAAVVLAGALLPGRFVRAGERDSRIEVLRTPEGGIQPQAAMGEDGTLHLIYFQGQPGGGDLYYVSRPAGKTEFSQPIRINSTPGTAIAIGSIRGGQLALGRGGRIHVVWNGAVPLKGKDQAHEGAPMLYTRSNAERTAFEPQRDLMTRTSALDGGGTVAADHEGNVYVAWHGRAPGAVEGEQGRRLWISRSRDDGATFSPEEPADSPQTGACACCGTRALADRRGAVYILYRAAIGGVERDLYLLRSSGPSGPFEGKALGAWKVNMCPMSSASLTDAGSSVLAAWETRGQVEFARVDPRDGAVSSPTSPPGRGLDRKHPAIAANARGEILLAWTEGTGWQRGGALAWQVFDRDGHPTSEKGRVKSGIPVWGLPTAVARPDGGFIVIH